ncbi:helix-turn-helix domain-containing protein [Lentibacillus saliphilus]|uniref:helix-turn-helix domain-containing protein n=1 Tax=Lentibacillus saliphilus TaxID=2737028 RepID=UPI001C2F5832|nr:helix-turn-helix transcriptional regulator [Lentibacillus saliphilus]
MDLERMAYNIKYFREQNGWTQLQLSEQLMTSRSVIAKWENNVAKPDIESLVRMSDLFNMSVDQLVGHVPLRDDVMKDFKQKYSSTHKSYEEDAIRLAEYLKVHPDVMAHLHKIKDIPFKKQQSVFKIIDTVIDELNDYHN